MNLKVTSDLLIFVELVTHPPRTKDQPKKSTHSKGQDGSSECLDGRRARVEQPLA